MEIKRKGERKGGISLITLVITVVVIIILAAAVILSLNSNNPIGSASDALKESDRGNIQDKVTMVLGAIQAKYLCSVEVTPGEINDGIEYTLINPQVLGITGGIIGWNEKKADETGKDNSFILEIEMPTYGLDDTTWYIDNQARVSLKVGDKTFGEDVADEDDKEELGEGTRNLEEAAYNKPYVPEGFTYVEGIVNEGYVVADSKGSEYVWVPVDGERVKFEKWCKTGISYDDPNLVTNFPLDELITPIVNSVGGFYIGRYEIGMEEDTQGTARLVQPLDPITKKGKKVCTVEEVAKLNPIYINQNDAKSTSFTGTVWDTVMKWLKESGYDVEGDSSLYGNYSDDSGNGSLKLSGSNENWKMNNIYDLAGNIAETGRDEVYILNSNTRIINNSSIIVRGGSYKNKGNEMSISSRAGVEEGQTNEVNDVGSRLLIIVGDMSTIM